MVKIINLMLKLALLAYRDKNHENKVTLYIVRICGRYVGRPWKLKTYIHDFNYEKCLVWLNLTFSKGKFRFLYVIYELIPDRWQNDINYPFVRGLSFVNLNYLSLNRLIIKLQFIDSNFQNIFLYMFICPLLMKMLKDICFT